jgi:hypothetical protein
MNITPVAVLCSFMCGREAMFCVAVRLSDVPMLWTMDLCRRCTLEQTQQPYFRRAEPITPFNRSHRYIVELI